MGRQSRDWLDTTGAELRDRGRDSADLGVDLDNQQPLHPCPPVDDNVVSRGESLRGGAQTSSSRLPAAEAAMLRAPTAHFGEEHRRRGCSRRRNLGPGQARQRRDPAAGRERSPRERFDAIRDICITDVIQKLH